MPLLITAVFIFKIAELFTANLNKSRGVGNKIFFEMENVGVNQWKELIVDVGLVECVPSVLIGLEEKNKSIKIPATTGIRREHVQSNRIRFTVRDCLLLLLTIIDTFLLLFSFSWPSLHC